MEPPPSNHGLHDRVTLAELLGALSYALDLTEGQPAGHCVRCSRIGVEIGREIGLGEQEITELYYVLLLKDLGCSSNAARICELYLTDDLSFKQDFKLIDGSLSQALRFVLSHTGLKAGLAERFRAIVNIFQNGAEIARELIETRCHRGADIARKMRFSEPVAEGIKNLDEHWDGSGKPLGLSGTAIPIYSRIALLAQVVDVFHVANGPEAALREAKNRSGVWFDPDLVAAFERVAASRGFPGMLGTDDGRACANSHAPAQASRPIDEDYLDDIAAAFAQVVDSKSPYTSGHSERVTLFTDMIAEELMLSAEQRRKLKRAALLHDIGKLDAYTADPLAIDMTDLGKLQGEIPLGYYRVRRAIEDLPGFPSELAVAVLHIILSHHGQLEHGSPVVPCTREATLVHMIDNLGGRLGSFDRLEKELPEGSSWSNWDRVLGGAGWFASRAA